MKGFNSLMFVERFHGLLEKMASEIGLQEGAAGIKRILVEIYRAGNASVHDLSKRTLLPPPTISLILNLLAEKKVVHRDASGARFTGEWMAFVERELGVRSLPITWCEACDGLAFAWAQDAFSDEFYDEIDDIVAARPAAAVELDQAKCNSDTLVRRVGLMHALHAFDGTRVLYLGDDDFVSVAARTPSFIQDFYIPFKDGSRATHDATVLDIDDRILGKISEIDDTITTIHHDVRKPLPAALQGKFDVVFTDPPYTVNGAILFLSRAVDALKKQKGTLVFFSFGHVGQDTMLEIQRAIVKMGFTIGFIVPRFNEYEGGNVLGGHSQMFVLLGGANLEPVVPTGEIFTGPLYTAESNGS